MAKSWHTTLMNTTSTTDYTNISLIAVAEPSIQTSVASLCSKLATIITKLGKEHILLLTRLDSKKSIPEKLKDNEDVILHLERLEFQLSGLKWTEQRPELIVLVEETAIMVNTYQKALRGQVIKALLIKITSIEEEATEQFF
jgi:hypothetical protein